MSDLHAPNPAPEEDQTPEEACVPQDVDAINAQAKETFEGLHAKGVEYLVLEGMGYQFFVQEVSMTGEVVATRTEEVPAGEEDETRQVQVITLRDADSSREFQLNNHIDIKEGQTISVGGVATFFINGAADFIGGVTVKEQVARLKSLKEMLNDTLIGVATTISVDDEQIYVDRGAIEQIQDMRDGWQTTRDHWKELLSGFQEQEAS